MCVCVRACVRACACRCVCVCTCVRVCVTHINKTSPMFWYGYIVQPGSEIAAISAGHCSARPELTTG